jgi:DNA-binding CsgD family transcriptional regulator
MGMDRRTVPPHLDPRPDENGTSIQAGRIFNVARAGFVTASLRRKGENLQGEMPRGTHVCIYYESIDDLIDTVVVPFFKTGLEKNEFCVWVPSKQLTLEQSRMALGRRIPNFDRHLAAGHMEIVPDGGFLKGDQFDVIRNLDMWRDMLSAALAKGYTGMRASGDAFWLCGRDGSINPGRWKSFSEYEYKLNKVLKGKPVALLCCYPLIMRGATEVLEVAGAHRPAVGRRNGDWELVETTATTPRDNSPTPQAKFIELLSERERHVINWMAQGHSNKEIARGLGIAPETVKSYVGNIFTKLNVHKRTRAVALAQSLGIVNTQ